jgi:hypothetical protein
MANVEALLEVFAALNHVDAHTAEGIGAQENS